jgi:predicted RNA binding protein YcfA (HicA-like mRNA interferase family)
MTNVPSLTGKKLLSALKKAGFEMLRVKGSTNGASLSRVTHIQFERTQVGRRCGYLAKRLNAPINHSAMA